MSRRDQIYKWAAYGGAFLLVCLVETSLLNRWPLFGIIPVLMPIAAVTVAFLDGPVAGAIFGGVAGLICNAAYYGSHGSQCLLLALLGAAVGLVMQYGLVQNMAGHLICAAGALVLYDGLRILLRLLGGTQGLGSMLQVAAGEILWSLCFAPLIYLLFRAVRRRMVWWE